jgi:dTDP-4-dehydrorhamnose reductase
LVLGASGMAGHVIYTYLKENINYNVYGTVNTNKLMMTMF